MMKEIVRFIEDESGLQFIEYALIAGLVSIAILGSLRSLGSFLTNWFLGVSTELATAG